MSHFYETEVEIWAALWLAGSSKISAMKEKYAPNSRAGFLCFHDQNKWKIDSLYIAASELKICIKQKWENHEFLL